VRDRLTPLLGEAFGGCAGLVDIEVVRGPHGQTRLPYGDRCVAKLDVSTAANGTGILADHSENDSVAEFVNLDGLGLKLVVSA
jgi:hypothetical protein